MNQMAQPGPGKGRAHPRLTLKPNLFGPPKKSYYVSVRAHHGPEMFMRIAGMTRHFDALLELRCFAIEEHVKRYSLCDSSGGSRHDRRALSTAELLLGVWRFYAAREKVAKGTALHFGVGIGTVSNWFVHVIKACHRYLKSLSEPTIVGRVLKRSAHHKASLTDHGHRPSVSSMGRKQKSCGLATL